MMYKTEVETSKLLETLEVLNVLGEDVNRELINAYCMKLTLIEDLIWVYERQGNDIRVKQLESDFKVYNARMLDVLSKTA